MTRHLHSFEHDTLDRARRVRLLITDVDGVLTDGGMYYSEQGEICKKFNTRDGKGISLLQAAGIQTAIVTSERTGFSTRRAEKLGITEVYTGVENKLSIVRALCERLEVSLETVCYIGDDVNDLEVLQAVGLACAVADAVSTVKASVHYITGLPGGSGAVREVCELILQARQTTQENTAAQASLQDGIPRSDGSPSTKPAELISMRAARQAAAEPCVSCGTREIVPLATRLRNKEPFAVVGCPTCGLAHIDPFPTNTLTYYEAKYRQETGPDILAVRARGISEAQRRWEHARPLLPAEPLVLDIGCGSGGFLCVARGQSGVRILGVEPDKSFRQHLHTEGFEVYETLSMVPKNRFDLIVLFHVLEHIEEPSQFLESLQHLLAPHGRLIVEVPCIADPLLWVYNIPAFWDFYWQYAHIWYFSSMSLERMLCVAGYKVVLNQGVQRYGLLNHLQWLNEGVPGQGQNFSDFISPSIDATYRERLIQNGFSDTLWLECQVKSRKVHPS